MSTTLLLLDALRKHVPSALYPLLLEYADDSLDRFIEARDTFLWFDDVWEETWSGHETMIDTCTHNRKLQETCWNLYRTRFHKTCHGGYLCMALIYQEVVHKRPPACHCTDPVLAECPIPCKVCAEHHHHISS
jgi:hypothetical protein